jgi:hypothetical protein
VRHQRGRAAERQVHAAQLVADGTALALLESDGIHIFENIPDLRAASPNCGQITDRLLVRGSATGLGPADVPAGSTGGQPGGGNAQPPASAMTR